MGGLPSIEKLPMHADLSLTDHCWEHDFLELKDGDLVLDERINSQVSGMIGPGVMLGPIIVLRLNHKKRFVEADPANPYRVIIPVFHTTTISMILRPTVIEDYRLHYGEPYFVNGHHEFIIDSSPVSIRHFLFINCDAGLKDALCGT